ncbi:MAG: hypothetical protein WCL90_02965 [Planctomycetota bacterium]
MIKRRNLLQWLGLSPFFWPLPLSAAENYRLSETFSPGNRFKIQTATELSGSMLFTPPNQPSKQIQIKGKSQIDFDETILTLDSSLKVNKSLREYRKVELSRTLDGQNQETILRPQVRTMVLLRNGSKKIPFSLEAPLTWNELDLIRTEVFPCALAGLFPLRSVALNESWNAGLESVQELTDLEVLESSQVVCKLDSVNLVNNRKTARISFLGKASGINEDGPNQQILDGYIFFDCETRHLSFLYLKGTSILKNKEGKDVGRIEGRYTISREMLPAVQLDTKSIYEPDANNTRLLFESRETSFSFHYPRNWRVTSQSDSQATLDQSKEAGLLITKEKPSRYLSSAMYRDEALAFVRKQQMRIENQSAIEPVNGTPGLEFFSWDVQIEGRRMHLLYFVYRTGQNMFTLASRCSQESKLNLRSDIMMIANSIKPTEKSS